MAQKRDFLDDLIDIQSDWQALSNPLGNLADTLAADPSKRKVFNPADYKEKPYANSTRCLCVASDNEELCTLCRDVCPTNAIEIHKSSVSVNDDCRKCNLCVAACPMEALANRRHMPRGLYDRVARIASAYEQCYVTCTRALKRLPKDNEVVLGCVGYISRDVWFSLMADYDNVSVYLPLGICDRCKTTTGEQFYCDAIGTAETWAQASMNLVTEESEMTHELTREYKRSQFMSSAMHSAENLLTKTNPALAGAKAVAKKISDHASRLDAIQRQIEAAVGAKTSNNRQRMMTQNRKLMMGALQHDPGLAKYVDLQVPVADASLCTMCGECTKVCTTRAIDLDNSGHITVQSAYCTSCGACAKVCEAGALAMEKMDVSELVVPDKQAEELARKKAQAKAEAQKYIEEGKKQLSRAADALEGLSDEDGK